MRRPLRYSLTTLFAASLLLGSQPAVAVESGPTEVPQGCKAFGNTEVCLTDPTAASDGRDRLLEERLIKLVDATKDGDSIRMAMFTWTRPGLAKALVAAKERGVSVKVVLDGINKEDNNEPYQVLKDGDVSMTNCDDSCLGSNINHAKYFLFEVGDKKIVAVTSSNMTTSQTEMFNNLVKVTGDDKLYDFYMGFWQRMNAESWSYDGEKWADEDKAANGEGGRAGYAYPRKGDNVRWMLDSVTDCSKDADDDGDPDNRVWLSASMFTSPRAAVAERLVQLQDKDCDVRVIVADAESEKWVQKAGLKASKVGHLASSHNKLMLIDAKYLGEWDDVTFTGSHNLTGTSLETNDEVVMRLGNDEVTKLYKSYFEGMFEKADGT